MQVSIIGIFDAWIVVEYELKGRIQHKYLPRGLVQTTIKGPATLDRKLVLMGVEVSDAHVVDVLGALYGIDEKEAERIQDKLRRAGFWMVQHYEANPMGVRRVLKSADVPVDVALFNNELRRRTLL